LQNKYYDNGKIPLKGLLLRNKRIQRSDFLQDHQVKERRFAVDYKSPAEPKKLSTEHYELNLSIAKKLGLRK